MNRALDPLLILLTILSPPDTYPQAVVLSESLTLRLPGCPDVCADMMRSAIHGEVEGLDTGIPAATAAVSDRCGLSDGARLAPSGGTPSKCGTAPGAPSAGHRLCRPSSEVWRPEGRLAVASMLCSGSCDRLSEPPPVLEERDAAAALGTASRPRPSQDMTSLTLMAEETAPSLGEACPSMREEAFGRTLRFRELMRRLFEPHWPSAGLREWVYTVTRRVGGVDGTPRDNNGDEIEGQQQRQRLLLREDGEEYRVINSGGIVLGLRLMCGSRMYLQQGEGEMRVALALAATSD